MIGAGARGASWGFAEVEVEAGARVGSPMRGASPVPTLPPRSYPPVLEGGIAGRRAMGVLTGRGDWATAVWETGLPVLMLVPVPVPNRGGWDAKRLLRLNAAARH